MRKFLVIFILIAIVLFVGGAVNFFNFRLTRNQSQPDGKIFKVGSAVFQVEIADTIEKHATGLSGRNELEKGRGMLFVFDQPIIPGFWMKGMNFPLDIIWIRNRKVSKIDHDVPLFMQQVVNPPTYQPPSVVDYVLELPAGVAKTYGFTVGSSFSVISND